ncbi:MAG: 30S ribosomal protein S18 [Gemmatimonadetes bacterium]|jgi:small subunit ribosomal protein S18|nr:30S ribosomal protein S18 [Gemmatimonadota bacterium]MBA3969070.1 30S ribosomal protein S18 [Gemmatimonadota bacterium]MDQ3308829.1 30S ribosomal protein S18 [Gemmatimonadota bacterium]
MRMPRKVCPVCESGARVLDYKDERTVSRFVTERGKILPRRISGMCARHQRQASVAIKRARYLALIPYIAGFEG